jgi:hypothetical protein
VSPVPGVSPALYLASLVLAAAATALLLGPVAYHRLLFRRGQKEGLMRSANVMAILGLAAVGLAVSAAVLMVTSHVAGPVAAALITAFVFCSFAGLSFAFPLTRRRRGVLRS